jgi:alpha-glucosidase
VPVFVRAGSIIASQDPQQYVGQRPVSKVMLDVFPDDRLSEFSYYDDDGVSYRYENGEYLEQKISAQRTGRIPTCTFRLQQDSSGQPLRNTSCGSM